MSKRWLIGGAAFLAVLLIASLVVALTESEDTLSGDTAEGAVQRYLMAVQDEDFLAAHGLLSKELREECTIEAFAGGAFRDGKGLAESRVTLEDKKDLNGSALVVARVTQIRGSSPFGTSESSFEQRFTLAQEDGEWRLTQYPWPYLGCGGPFPERPRPVEPAEWSAPAPAPTPEPAPTAAPQ